MDLRNKKILYLGLHTYNYDKNHKAYYGGGSEVMCEYVLNFLLKFTKDIHYFVVSGPGTMIDAEYKDHYGISFVKRWYFDYHYLEDYMKKYDFDLVLLNTFLTPRASGYINKTINNSGLPVVELLHGVNCSHPDSLKPSYLKNPKVTFIVATQHEKDLLLQKGVTSERVNLIDYPSDFKNQEDLKEINLSAGVISIARMTPQKGLINSAKIAKAMDVKFTCIGKTRSKLAKAIMQEILDTRCEYEHLGVLPREELEDILSQSAFYVALPDEPEGTSLVMKEAMTLGVPVITWRDYSFEYTIPRDMCILLTHDDNYIQEFKEKYLPVIDKYLSIENREKLRDYAISRFSLDKFYENLDSILLKVEES